MITVIGCNKGGAGKSTTCINVSTGLHRLGFDICGVDADGQRSFAIWMEDREESGEFPLFPLIERQGKITATLKSLDEKYQHVIVDVPGRNSRELITAASIADIIIAPHQCSQLDLDTMGELAAQVDAIRDSVNPNLKVFVYHAIASTNPVLRASERDQFLTFLADFPQFTALESIGHYRKVYRDVISTGASVLETSNVKAAAEINELIKEVYGYGR